MENTSSTTSSKGRFVPEVEKALRAAGWFPGRLAPKNQLEKWLIIDRFPNGNPFQTRMFSSAWRIMSEFGGLSVKTPVNPRGYYEEIIFDPLLLGKDWWNEIFWMAEWEGTTIYPLGTTKEEIIAVTGSGQIINDNDIWRGDSIEEAMTYILLGQPFEPIVRETDLVKDREAASWLESMRSRFEDW